MTNLTAVDSFDPIPRLETSTPAQAGPGGAMTLQAQALANRTQNTHLRVNRIASVIGEDGSAATARDRLGIGDLMLTYTQRGDWVGGGEDYDTNNIALVDGTAYLCVIPHNSDDEFNTDFNAGRWIVFQGLLLADLIKRAALIPIEFFGVKPSPWGDSDAGERAANDAAIEALLAWLAASSVSLSIVWPYRRYNFSATWDCQAMNRKLDCKGGGYTQTEIVFYAPSDDDDGPIPLILLPDINCTYSSFTNFRFRAATPGTGQFCRVRERSAQTGGDGVANWKNYWGQCLAADFAVGMELTSPDPTDGDVGEQASESTLFNLKFRNCRRTFWIRNRMAYNTTFIAVDVENDQETGDQKWDMVRDDNGGGIKVFGGSWIGKGALYRFGRRYSGSLNFSGSTILFQGVRLECRPTHGEGLIVQDTTSIKDETMWVFVTLRDCHLDLFTQTVNVVKMTNRAKITIDGCNADNGIALIQHNPTASSANTAVGSLGSVSVDKSHGFKIGQDTGNTYGSFSRQQTIPMVVRNRPASNGTFSVDADGFMIFGAGGICQQQLGHVLTTAEEFSLVLNDSAETDGSAINDNIKFALPPFAMPLTFGLFKQPVRFTSAFTYELYLVKDKANWAGGTFSRTSDAVRVAVVSVPANSAGWAEAAIALQSNIIGFRFQAGFTSWTEGRMLIRKYLGPDELLTNPGFAASTGWTVNTGWAITGGKAVATSAASGTSINQAGIVVAGRTYDIGLTCDSISAGGFKVLVEGGASVFGDKTTAGTFTGTITAASTGRVYIWANSTLSATFDDMTVKEVSALPVSGGANFGGFFRIKYI